MSKKYEDHLKNRIGFFPGGKVENTVYLTPRWIIDALGPFDTDPFASSPRPFDVGTKFNLTGRHNGGECGFEALWKGFIWLNPPYGKRNGENAAVLKLSNHPGGGIALLNVKPATELWRDIILPAASGILLLSRRVIFTDAAGTPSSGSFGSQCLVAFGAKARSRLTRLTAKGHILEVQRAVSNTNRNKLQDYDKKR